MTTSAIYDFLVFSLFVFVGWLIAAFIATAIVARIFAVLPPDHDDA